MACGDPNQPEPQPPEHEYQSITGLTAPCTTPAWLRRARFISIAAGAGSAQCKCGARKLTPSGVPCWASSKARPNETQVEKWRQDRRPIWPSITHSHPRRSSSPHPAAAYGNLRSPPRKALTKPKPRARFQTIGYRPLAVGDRRQGFPYSLFPAFRISSITD